MDMIVHCISKPYLAKFWPGYLIDIHALSMCHAVYDIVKACSCLCVCLLYLVIMNFGVLSWLQDIE